MKVLYLTFDDLTVPFAWSVHVRSLINALVAKGHELRLVCPGGKAPGINAPADALPTGRLHHVAGSLGTFTRSGRAFGPDVIYVRGIHATVTPALAAARLGRPLVVEINGLLEREAPTKLRRMAVIATHRFTLARAARIVTVSPLLKQALAGRYRFPADRIDVVPNGADTDLFRPGDRGEARRRLGLPMDRPIILCVASFYPHHSLGLLLEAARRARATLVLVGKEGPGTDDLIWAGRVPHDRVPEYIAAADVCAYVLRAPERQFGFSPIKVYEYMAGGRAVVAATDQEEIRSFVNENRIGRAVGLDAARFGDEIRALLEQPDERQRMGQRGRELAETTYTWKRVAEQVEKALSRAVKS